MNQTSPTSTATATPRRYRSPADKVRILRLHLLEGRAISEICEAEDIHPTMFYQWQKTFFEKGSAAFEAGRSPSRLVGKTERRLAVLEDKLRRKDEVIAEIMEDLVRTKKSRGELNGQWVPHDLRDTVVDFLRHHAVLTGLPVALLLRWLALCPRKFRRWQDRYGKVNEHNAMIPRDHWIEAHERAAIIDFARRHPLEGYRVLKGAGVIGSRPTKTSRKGRGFEQPLQPHEHWHVDFSCLNLGGTFYYLCSVLDGASRAILAWDIRPQMREADAGIVIQRAREAYPQARPRLITDNGPRFVAKDFKEFIRPQANHPRLLLA